jgi:hypothetical protein
VKTEISFPPAVLALGLVTQHIYRWRSGGCETGEKKREETWECRERDEKRHTAFVKNAFDAPRRERAIEGLGRLHLGLAVTHNS